MEVSNISVKQEGRLLVNRKFDGLPLNQRPLRLVWPYHIANVYKMAPGINVHRQTLLTLLPPIQPSQNLGDSGNRAPQPSRPLTISPTTPNTSQNNPPPLDLTNPPKQPLPWNLVQQAFSHIRLSKRRGIVVWDRTSQLLGFTVQGHTVSWVLIQLAGTSSSVRLVISLNKSCQSTKMLILLLQLVWLNLM